MRKGAAKRQKPTPATTSPARTSPSTVTTYPPVPPVPLRPMRRLLMISAILFAGWVSFLLYLYATTDHARSPAGGSGAGKGTPPADTRPTE